MRIGGPRAWGIVLLTGSLGLVLCGCLWGAVQDGQSGQPIPGARVTFYDMVGNTGTATTNSDGIYAFDAAAGTVPAAGTVAFRVSAPGYQTLSSKVDVQYDDSAAGAWEAQSFSLSTAPTPAPSGGG